MKKQPDIVVLVLDTQRADRLGCYGYPKPVSPNLDALAADATRYTQAVSPAQWTLPAHTSLLTGLYPSEHTVTQLNSVLPPAIPTLTERLHQAGYYNALLSNNPFIGALDNGLRRGFDRIVNYSYIGSGLWTSNFEQVRSNKKWLGRYRLQARRWLARLLGFDAAHNPNWFSPIFTAILEYLLPLYGGSKIHNTRQTLTTAADLLTRRKDSEVGDQPAFVFINLMGTHIPYAPPRWAMERFVSPVWGSRQSTALLHRANAMGLNVVNWLDTDLPEAEYQALLGSFYDAEVFAQDAQIGRFLTQLRKANRLDNTWLIVLADHGEYLGEKERLNHIFGAYQPLAQVPLLIYGPHRREPTVDAFVSTRRIFHTFL